MRYISEQNYAQYFMQDYGEIITGIIYRLSDTLRIVTIACRARPVAV